MTSEKSLNLLDLPKDPFELRSIILNTTAESATLKTARYIKEHYEKIEILETSLDFFADDLVNAAPSDGDSLAKLGLFPWIESAREIEKALSLIMLSLYKNSYDSLRRALELVVVGSFFILESIEMEKARGWVKSSRNTPNFKRALEKLIKQDPYATCEQRCQLSEPILGLYYRLSDFIHVKGMEKSYRKLTPSVSRFNDVEALTFNEKSCKDSLDLLIETIENISIICALTIPRLLIGFDLERKFGLNPPLSGFFEHAQAERINLLIPDRFRPYIDDLKKNDEGIRSITKWFENLPDITDEEFTRQCEEFRKENNVDKM